jgi:hypothetical protein
MRGAAGLGAGLCGVGVTLTVTKSARRVYVLPVTLQLAMYGAESIQLLCLHLTALRFKAAVKCCDGNCSHLQRESKG